MQAQPQASIRPAAVAGHFYPAEPGPLHSAVDTFLQKAEATSDYGLGADATPPKALIVPHAGYVYSGPVAATAYRLLSKSRGKISRVILLGPSHRFSFSGMAATSATAYETPLGLIPIDQEALGLARNIPLFGIADETHIGEHCLETQLPFLQVVLGDFKLLPIICGQVSGKQIADLLDRLWGGPETLIVVSSDLSHYHDYQNCRTIDASTCIAIEKLDPSIISHEQACGATPVKGLLTAAKRRGMQVKTLDLRNSGDTAGPRDRVVGYGAWAFWEQKTADLDSDDLVTHHGDLMVEIARQAICGGQSAISLNNLPALFSQQAASFVTLHKSGRLRGCCGSVIAHRPLIEDIWANATRSAFGDTRFQPLAEEEWKEITLSVTVLSSLQPMSFVSEADLLSQLQPHNDGLFIEDMGKSALFLPAVWETLPNKQQFLAHLKAKAGLSIDHWSKNFRANRFGTSQTNEVFLKV